jgi:oligopeptide/dipeptide ABC transporter ATP-binding protein
VAFESYQGKARVLDKVGLAIGPGEILGLVGESGCGKSVTARCVLRLIPSPPGRIESGQIWFGGQDILKLNTRELRRIRGNAISMIFQEPMTSLNPVYTVGKQMAEVVRIHQKVSPAEARAICAEMLAQVNLPDPMESLDKYPHELSGGMRQRVMIALALSCEPALLIADEPTTALDVTVQGQVLSVLTELVRQKGTSVLFITHDMGVVAQLCDRVCVMYAGRIAEVAPVHKLFARPAHPYTQGLIQAIPGVDKKIKALSAIPGQVPDLSQPPSGCRFHPRCEQRHDPCDQVAPPLYAIGPGHQAACHLYQSEEGS